MVTNAVCKLFVPPDICILSTCTGHTIKLTLCMCLVFAQQLQYPRVSPLSTSHASCGERQHTSKGFLQPLTSQHSSWFFLLLLQLLF